MTGSFKAFRVFEEGGAIAGSAVVGAAIVARPSEAAAAIATKVFLIVRVSLGEEGGRTPSDRVRNRCPIPRSGWAGLSPTNLTEM